MNEFANKLRHVAWWLVPLAVIAFAIVLEAELGRGMDPQPPAETPIEPKPVVTALLPEYVIEGGPAARTDTVSRTLFNPTRRPAPALAGDKGVSRMQRGQFTLAGTLLIDGNNTAYLKEANGGKQRRVRQGEQINGMTVADIKPDRVRLTLGDEAEELTLKVATNPRPTPTAVATAPAAATPTPVPLPIAAAPPGAVAGAANGTDELARRRAAARAAAAGNSPTGVPPASAVAPAAPGAAPAAADPAWAEAAKAYQTQTPVGPARRNK
jgi:hypothetical protein